MKQLLTTILLLLCSLAWGQDWGAVHASIVAEQTTEREIRELKPITLDMLLDYSEECYNDSTAYFKYKYEVHDWGTDVDQYWIEYSDDPPDLDVLYANREYIGKVTLWKHKKPTFEGFIEYLTNKYLEEQP